MKSKSCFAIGVLSSLLSASVAPVWADNYHSVEPGETLSSIAQRYNVSLDALRAANKLSVGDNAGLAAMLLRIPGADEKVDSSSSAPKSTPPVRSGSTGAARYFGSVTRDVEYTVREGDTLDSIAARFSGSGREASISAIRAKNNLSSGQPAAGRTLFIPVKTTYSTTQNTAQTVPQPRTYTRVASSASAQPAGRSADRGDIGVSVSEEMDLPFAREVPSSGAPIYTAPGASRVESRTTSKADPKSRGNLTSRGGYIPNPNLDGARVLQNGEELVTSPQPRVYNSAPAPTNLARVAKVAHGGARIRRLPEAGAVTLYRCATGTEIAVLKQSGMWSAILMSDRSTGWIPTRYLKFTGANVDISTQVVTDDDRDEAEGEWRGGYSSNHPAVRHALKWLGTPYRFGGESRRGIDCSSLVQHSFRACGVRLPRVSYHQARVGRPISPENLQPGDRLYFSAGGRRVDHTGIYMGNGLFVHASGSARRVVVSKLHDRRNWNIFVGARR